MYKVPATKYVFPRRSYLRLWLLVKLMLLRRHVALGLHRLLLRPRLLLLLPRRLWLVRKRSLYQRLAGLVLRVRLL